ncbi:MarR family winged helix-turn-helix transcriptional regulator [Nakamurella sp. GG22]
MGPSRTNGSRGLSGDRKTAWEGFLHCQAKLTQQLARELDDAGEIPLSTYDILVQLAESGGRLRLRDLVDRVVLSQPGLSRKVARLEEEGLLDRLPDPRDGRGVLVKISRSGRAALRSASVVHMSGIERLFSSQIDDAEAATLARVFSRLLADGQERDDAEHVGAGVQAAAATSARTARGRSGRSGGSANRGSAADAIPRQTAKDSTPRRRARS